MRKPIVPTSAHRFSLALSLLLAVIAFPNDGRGQESSVSNQCARIFAEHPFRGLYGDDLVEVGSSGMAKELVGENCPKEVAVDYFVGAGWRPSKKLEQTPCGSPKPASRAFEKSEQRRHAFEAPRKLLNADTVFQSAQSEKLGL
jgi:hypothetical protein